MDESEGRTKQSSLWWTLLPGELSELTLHFMFEMVE